MLQILRSRASRKWEFPAPAMGVSDGTPPALVPTLDQPFIFMHIQKTAGTTLRHFLMTRFPPGLAFNVPSEWRDGTGQLEEVHRSKAHLAYLGHINHRWIRTFPRPPHVFTVLRDPVERVISHFYFYRHIGQTTRPGENLGPIIQQTCELDLAEFLRREPQWAQTHFCEPQTRMFLDPQLHRHTPLTRSDVQLAKQRLRQCAVVGLSHRLLESLQLLCDACGWSRPAYLPTYNMTPAQVKREEVDSALLRRLHELTSCDRELYEEGVRLFEQAWAKSTGTHPKSFSVPFEQGITGDDRHEPERSTVPAKTHPKSFSVPFEQGITGDGWHEPEWSADGWFCWTTELAWLGFYLHARRRLAVTVDIARAIDRALFFQVEIWLNGHRIDPLLSVRRPWFSKRLRGYHGVVPAEFLVQPPSMNRITFKLPRTVRPCDVQPGNSDTRPLGLAISRVDIRAA